VVEQFTSRISKVARTLELKGYNYDDDTNTIVANQEVSSHGMGKIEIYDENVLNEKDAKRIAEIRAQEINCKEQVYFGTTLASNVVPGYRFKLKNHFRATNNQEYLVFDVHQNGSQRQLALAHLGLQNQTSKENDNVVFVTEFKAIPGKKQFRAPSNTPAKRIDGIIPAVLDAETSGEYAQLDDQGRYKIRLLHSDKADGQASDWVRKMESYIGNEYGHHFSMHKNTEICLAFQFGNPDRPVIMGGVHNSSNKNIVTSKNQKTSVTKSAGGNMIVMGDQKGQEYMHLHSPSGDR
jgi:type VI secretion system secreted protein VgrG